MWRTVLVYTLVIYGVATISFWETLEFALVAPIGVVFFLAEVKLGFAYSAAMVSAFAFAATIGCGFIMSKSRIWGGALFLSQLANIVASRMIIDGISQA